MLAPFKVHLKCVYFKSHISIFGECVGIISKERATFPMFRWYSFVFFVRLELWATALSTAMACVSMSIPYLKENSTAVAIYYHLYVKFQFKLTCITVLSNWEANLQTQMHRLRFSTLDCLTTQRPIRKDLFYLPT